MVYQFLKIFFIIILGDGAGVGKGRTVAGKHFFSMLSVVILFLFENIQFIYINIEHCS